MKGRLGKAEVITAGAHKLARIVYALIAPRKACDESEALKSPRDPSNASMPNSSNRTNPSAFNLFLLRIL